MTPPPREGFPPVLPFTADDERDVLTGRAAFETLVNEFAERCYGAGVDRAALEAARRLVHSLMQVTPSVLLSALPVRETVAQDIVASLVAAKLALDICDRGRPAECPPASKESAETQPVPAKE